MTAEIISPLKLQYEEYTSRLRQTNLQRIKMFRNYLESQLPANPTYVVVTTGSDGRLEKGAGSPLELILIYDEETDQKEIDAFDRTIREYTRLSTNPEQLSSSVERKLIKPEWIIQEDLDLLRSTMKEGTVALGALHEYRKNFLSYHKGENAYPTRILDAEYVFGDEKLLKTAKFRLIAEIHPKGPFKTHKGSLGSSITDEFFERTKERFDVVKNCGIEIKPSEHSPGLVHYDLERFLAWYDESSHGSGKRRGSFKFGPLRSVQYGIADGIFGHLRNIDDGITLEKASELALNFDPSIESRLSFLRQQNVLKFEDTTNPSSPVISDKLKDAYDYFLWLYHCSQAHSARNYSLDPEEASTLSIKGLTTLDQLASKHDLIRSIIEDVKTTPHWTLFGPKSRKELQARKRHTKLSP